MRHSLRILGALALLSLTGQAQAHFVPAPCDFITGGGWVFANSGAKANFGAHGGCKHGAFWGHVNVVDHSADGGHLRSTRITGYLMDPAFPNARDICGEGEVKTADGRRVSVRFRTRLEDNGEPGGLDRFGLRLSSGYHLSTRELGPAGQTGGGGNIQLHKPNPSTTGPSPAPTEAEMCGGLMWP
ncbi:MAG: post-COAP-1 domain-containing protein [Burkholderiales bacterium]